MMLGDLGGAAGASEVEEEQAERASRRMDVAQRWSFMGKIYGNASSI
jgi:hypothetical protein